MTILQLENNFGPSSQIYGLQAVISPAKSKQTIKGDLCGLAKMATNASTQEHRLTSEDQIVHLPTSEKEKSPDRKARKTHKKKLRASKPGAL